MTDLSRRCSLWISVFLLFIISQMLTCLVISGGVFIRSKEILISPFRICPIGQHGELSCDDGYRASVGGGNIENSVPEALVIYALYVPLVLVSFALLAMLLAAYAKDRGSLCLSMACQGASSILTLTGVIAFLVLNWFYLRWDHMTLSFYVCVSVPVQLVVVTALTHVLRERLTSNWEKIHANEELKTVKPIFLMEEHHKV